MQYQNNINNLKINNLWQKNFFRAGSKNPLAYHYYDPEKVILGKKMKDWFKFAMAWWHTLCAEGADQFGEGTKTFPWNESSDPMQAAKDKVDAGFEFMSKM